MTSVSKNSSQKQFKNKLGNFDPTVAGIDIGANIIHVAIPDQKSDVVVKSFGTTTPKLHQIADALQKAGVLTAVMEATGVYWIPLYEILEERGIDAVLVDAKGVKNVPGRKTDVVDCQWIQTLWSNGLLRRAYRPPRDRLALRTYVRGRQNIIKTKRTALLHIEKALQLMNIKLSGVLSDIAGISGMDIIRAIDAGERDPLILSGLRNRRVSKAETDFLEALTGNFQEPHLQLLRWALQMFDFAMEQLKDCDRSIEEELEKLPTVTEEPLPERQKAESPAYSILRKPKKNALHFDGRTLLWRKSGIDLTALPGIEANTALLVFAELGGYKVDAWKSEKEFASWLKLCPGNNISGGKRRKSSSQPSVNYITQILRMAAMSAKKSKTSIGARIRRIARKTDNMRGVKAGAHRLAILIYGMCKHGWKYLEMGEAYYEERVRQNRIKYLHRQAKELGYELNPFPEKNPRLRSDQQHT